MTACLDDPDLLLHVCLANAQLLLAVRTDEFVVFLRASGKARGWIGWRTILWCRRPLLAFVIGGERYAKSNCSIVHCHGYACPTSKTGDGEIGMTMCRSMSPPTGGWRYRLDIVIVITVIKKVMVQCEKVMKVWPMCSSSCSGDCSGPSPCSSSIFSPLAVAGTPDVIDQPPHAETIQQAHVVPALWSRHVKTCRSLCSTNMHNIVI